MSEAAVQLKVAGQIYRVVTNAPESELKRLAEQVEDALAQVTPPGRQPQPQAFVLAAITLAHELEEERKARQELEERYRRTLGALLERVNHALGDTPEPAEVTVRAGARTRTRNDL